MKIIFLDVDNVLNTDAEYTALYKRLLKENIIRPDQSLREAPADLIKEEHMLMLLSSKRVGFINEVAAATEASIVLSSSWRHPSTIFGFDAIQLLKKAGLVPHIVGKTGGDDITHNRRGGEIAKYIKKNGIKSGDYVIVDDDPSTKNARRLTNHKNSWVQTGNKGLTWKQACLMIEILNKGSSE